MPDKDINIKFLKELIQNPRIGELLLHHKKITIDQLGKGLEMQREKNIPIGQILIQMEIITENELVELLSMQSNIDRIVKDSYDELEMLSDEINVQ